MEYMGDLERKADRENLMENVISGVKENDLLKVNWNYFIQTIVVKLAIKMFYILAHKVHIERSTSGKPSNLVAFVPITTTSNGTLFGLQRNPLFDNGGHETSNKNPSFLRHEREMIFNTFFSGQYWSGGVWSWVSAGLWTPIWRVPKYGTASGQTFEAWGTNLQESFPKSQNFLTMSLNQTPALFFEM